MNMHSVQQAPTRVFGIDVVPGMWQVLLGESVIAEFNRKELAEQARDSLNTQAVGEPQSDEDRAKIAERAHCAGQAALHLGRVFQSLDRARALLGWLANKDFMDRKEEARWRRDAQAHLRDAVVHRENQLRYTRGLGMNAEQLEKTYNANGDGGEHPELTRDLWRACVAGRLTLLSYWQWLQNSLAEA